MAAVLAFVVAWVAYKASQDPRVFVIVTLNGVTLAGLYFVVASGFTLIFGLMRVVNMAHGSLYMLAGFFAFDLQDRLTGGEATSAFGSSEAGVGFASISARGVPRFSSPNARFWYTVMCG